MKIQTFDNVWDAISTTHEEAENMKIRSQLIIALNAWIAKSGMTQAEVALALGISQPRVSELARGKIHLFSVDKLIAIMAHAGMYITHIEISEPAVA